MSNTWKIVIAIAVVVLVGAGFAYFYMSGNQGQEATPGSGITNTGQVPANGSNPPAQSQAVNNPNAAISATDTSNASLDKDLSTVDSQLNGLTSDNTNINQSLNDQPIPQGQ